LCAAVSLGRAREWVKILLTRRARQRRRRVRPVPFKTARRALVRDFAFPFASFLPRACPLSSELFRLHISSTARVPGSPETSPARCQAGRAPLSLASSFFVSLRRASCLPSPRLLSGSSLPTSPCHTLPGGTWCRSWPSTSAAFPSPPADSSEECCLHTGCSYSTSIRTTSNIWLPSRQCARGSSASVCTASVLVLLQSSPS
jgi:hypothetical protein